MCNYNGPEHEEQRLLHHVPTELAVDLSTLPPPSKVSEGGQRVYAAIHRKFKDTTRKVPHVVLSCDADGRHFWDSISLCWNGLNLQRLWAWFHNWVRV
jgi:hypothetical protein